MTVDEVLRQLGDAQKEAPIPPQWTVRKNLALTRADIVLRHNPHTSPMLHVAERIRGWSFGAGDGSFADVQLARQILNLTTTDFWMLYLAESQDLSLATRERYIEELGDEFWHVFTRWGRVRTRLFQILGLNSKGEHNNHVSA